MKTKQTALPANVAIVECLAGICEVAKYRNGSTDSRGESLPANTFKWGGQFLFLHLFTLCCYIHRLCRAMINTYLHFPGRVERASTALQ